MSGYEVRSTHNAGGWGLAISAWAMMGSDGLKITNMCNLLNMCKPSADTDFTQNVDELVVFRRRGNRHFPQHLIFSV
jgi:hypothetical protein